MAGFLPAIKVLSEFMVQFLSASTTETTQRKSIQGTFTEFLKLYPSSAERENTDAENLSLTDISIMDNHNNVYDPS